jgi:hypothetical protein
MHNLRNKLNRFAEMAFSWVIPKAYLDGSEDKISLSMTLGRSVYDRLERLKIRSDAYSLAELFQAAFASYEMILDCALRGDRLIARGKDGIELEISILRYE